MRRIASLSTIAIIALILGAHLGAEQGAGHNHIGHVMDAWNDTPDGVGLLPAAVEEAGVAAQHASLAAKDPSNLDAMKRHAAPPWMRDRDLTGNSALETLASIGGSGAT